MRWKCGKMIARVIATFQRRARTPEQQQTRRSSTTRCVWKNIAENLQYIHVITCIRICADPESVRHECQNSGETLTVLHRFLDADSKTFLRGLLVAHHLFLIAGQTTSTYRMDTVSWHLTMYHAAAYLQSRVQDIEYFDIPVAGVHMPTTWYRCMKSAYQLVSETLQSTYQVSDASRIIRGQARLMESDCCVAMLLWVREPIILVQDLSLRYWNLEWRQCPASIYSWIRARKFMRCLNHLYLPREWLRTLPQRLHSSTLSGNGSNEGFVLRPSSDYWI